MTILCLPRLESRTDANGTATAYGGAMRRNHFRRRALLSRAGEHAVNEATPRVSGALPFAMAALSFLVALAVPATAKTLSIVAFGDSLTAGYMLAADQAFPAVLERALRKDGFDIAVANAGVSGDTTAGGLDRLDWSVPDGTDGVILELGANDMLRGQDPALARRNLEAMIAALQKRRVAVFLAGMVATPTLGAAYVDAFNAIYPDLAKAHDIPLYPFFLDGVVGQAKLQLEDGMHPNATGVETVVRGIVPSVEAWVKTLPKR